MSVLEGVGGSLDKVLLFFIVICDVTPPPTRSFRMEHLVKISNISVENLSDLDQNL